MNFDSFASWLAGAVAIVGIIQWAKGACEKIIPDKLPSWVWSLVLPAVAVGVSFTMTGEYFWNLCGTWAIAQLGYEVIIQAVKKKVGG